ncbi:MAG TPA: protein kinase [Acidobacteriota bacterium]|nr:protein kinase [Acidobacteriota bacterium]
MSLVEGQSFGSYEILHPLGRGGMGEVYLALDRRLKRKVAIKILSTSLVENRDQLLRFRKEAEVAAGLNHPNICTVYEANEVNGTIFIAMEYIEGETLRHYLSSHKVSADEILDYAIQIADALKEAHSKNVIHRDIKTANMILTPRKSIKVLDFGLAKQIHQINVEQFSEASTDFSTGPVGVPRGTIPYMSPECVLGRKIDHRSDLFSLGVVLYEMIFGHLPFRGNSNVETIDAILHSDPITGSQTKIKVPDSLLRVLGKMLEKDPEMRYQSAHELWIDLRKIREEITRADSLPPTQVQVHKRFSFVKWAALVLILSFFAGSAIYFYLAEKSPPEQVSISNSDPLKKVAVLKFQYSGDSEHKYFGTLVTDALIAGMESEPGVSVAPYITVLSIDKNQPVQETAKKLGVDWIIRGKVSSKNANVIIEPEVMSSDGKSLWTQTINGTVDGIVTTLTTTKNALVSELKISKTPKGKEVSQLRTPITGAYELYIEARSYHESWDKEEDLTKAIELYRNALEIDPDSGAAHAGLAAALLTQYGKSLSPPLLVEADSEAQKAINLSPYLPEAQIANGLVKLKTGNSVEAKVAFSRALELSPGNDYAFINIGRVYEDSGRFEEAKEMYDRAISLRPTSWSNYYNLGLLMYVMGNFNSAREPFLKATELAPNSSAPRVMLGIVDLYRGDLDSAENSFRKVLENSSDVYARNGLGLVYSYRGQHELALRTFQSLLNELPDQVLYEINLADCFKGLGNDSEAKRHNKIAEKKFRELIATNSKDDQSRAGLAMALSAMGDCQEANEQVQDVLTRQKAPEFAVYAMVVKARCGDLKSAETIALDQIKIGNVCDVKYHPDLKKLRELPSIKSALAQN